MARWLKQSTSVDVPIGPFLDATDGVTAETGLTITQPDIRLKKNGGAWAQKNASQTLSHEENGYYEVTLDATDTNTLGLLRLAVNESGALPVWEDFLVVPANVWDSLFSTDLLQVDAREWLGGTIATPTVTGVPEVDVTHLLGTAHATPNTAGLPDVNAIQVSNIASVADKLETLMNGCVHGTADSGSTTTMVDAALTQADTDWFKGSTIVFTSGTLAGQKALITAFTPGTDTVTFAPAVTAAVSTHAYIIIPWGLANLIQWSGSTPNALSSGLVDANVGAISTDATAADNAEAFFDGTGYAGTNNVIPSVTTVTGNVNGNVGGNVTGTVGGFTASAKAEIESEANDALVAIHLDHLIASADPGGVVANSSFLAKLTSKSATPAFSSYNNTTDSLEAIRDKAVDIETDTQDLQTQIGAAGAGLTAVPWNAAWDAEVQSEVNDALTAAATESYATDGAAASPVQMLYAIMQRLNEHAISGTTVTVKKLDGSTTAMTFTLNNAVAPTSITRAS